MIRYETDHLLEKVDSKYTLVIAAAKRARQITEYLNAIKRSELPHVLPPQVPMEEAVKAKPISVALEEILNGSIEYERIGKS